VAKKLAQNSKLIMAPAERGNYKLAHNSKLKMATEELGNT
jgi:hypothetical protein